MVAQARYPGVYKWIERWKIKDPRDKDSTLFNSKRFFTQKLWQIIYMVNQLIGFFE